MAEYLAPGVYVEEVSFRPKSIEGVSTSTTSFVGPTLKGPLSGTPEVVTSFGEFARLYGGLGSLSFSAAQDANPNTLNNYLAHAVRNFFDNGGRRLYIARTFIPRTNPVSDGLARSALVVDNADGQASFIARMPGMVLNGVIRAIQKRTPATAVSLGTAPEGSLLRVGGDNVAQPASLTGGTAPFTLSDGDQLTLTLRTGPSPVVFNGTAAEAMGTALADPLTIPPATVLTVTIGGVEQTILLADGDIALNALVAQINIELRHGYARLEGGNQLVIGTDVRGTDAQVSVAANAILGFAAPTADAGTGNVADLGAVMVAEINQILQDAGVAAEATQSLAGELVLATTELGALATLQVDDTPARTALGLPAEAAQGTAGAPLAYYLKDGGNWVDRAEAILDVGGLTDPAELVTMTLEAEDAEGTVIAYEELAFGPAHPRYVGIVLQQEPSRRAEALRNPYYLEIAAGIHPFDLRAGMFGNQDENAIVLSGGNDGLEPIATDDSATTISYKDALELLEDIEDISIVAATRPFRVCEFSRHLAKANRTCRTHALSRCGARLATAANLVGSASDSQFYRLQIRRLVFPLDRGGQSPGTTWQRPHSQRNCPSPVRLHDGYLRPQRC